MGATMIYFAYNPSLSRWFPQCPVKMLTGLSCPGCGVQRAFHSLLHGQFGEALSYNYFFVLSIPYLFVACLAVVMKKLHKCEKLAMFLHGEVLAWIYVVCFVVWFVVRNILGI